MKQAIADWFTPKRINAIAVGVLLAYALANLWPTGPYVQGPDENYVARHKKVTAITWGWPMTAYGVYPEGFISAWEPLAWDCEPIYAGWIPIGVGIDVLAFAILCLASVPPIRRMLAYILVWQPDE